MKKNKKELLIIFILLAPIIYLLFKWWDLPQEIILHNSNGEVISHISKYVFTYFILGNIIIYLLMLIWPKIDPKKRIQDMGNNYFIMRLLFSLYTTVFATYYIISMINDFPPNNNALFAFVGVMLAVFGNYMQTVRPNYFIGFKTPWTLESEYVWKKTHRIGGRLMIIYGTILLFIALFLEERWIFITCAAISLSQLLFLYIFSYIIFQKEKKRAALNTVVNEPNNN